MDDATRIKLIEIVAELDDITTANGPLGRIIKEDDISLEIRAIRRKVVVLLAKHE